MDKLKARAATARGKALLGVLTFPAHRQNRSNRASRMHPFLEGAPKRSIQAVTAPGASQGLIPRAPSQEVLVDFPSAALAAAMETGRRVPGLPCECL